MNKEEAMDRLDALEGEVKEIRGIIERGESKIVYDPSNVYVGVHEGIPYLMVGTGDEDLFRFHSFDTGNKSCMAWDEGWETGQECIDQHIDSDFVITAFDDIGDALRCFLDTLDAL